MLLSYRLIKVSQNTVEHYEMLHDTCVHNFHKNGVCIVYNAQKYEKGEFPPKL